MSGLGHRSQSGARAARIGSTCEPSRETCWPARVVTARGRPRAGALLRPPEDAERAACPAILLPEPLVVDPRHTLDVARRPGQQVLELTASGDPELDLGREPCGGEDGLEPVQRDELADEEAVER